MKKIKPKFFKTDSGHEPVRDWLLNLSRENKKKIGENIKLTEYGWPLGMPVCRPLGGGLYEVRVSLAQGRIERVIFCIEGDQMVLLHGFLKKSQKTPEKVLNLARNRRKVLKDDS